MITPEAQAGINQALDNANNKIPAWSEQALDHLIAFLNNYPFPFQAEEVRKFAADRGLPNPPVNRAWGGVMLGAARKGIIKKIGFQQTTNKVAHGSLAGVWVKNQ